MTEPTDDQSQPARALPPDHPTSPSTAILVGAAVPRHAAGPGSGEPQPAAGSSAEDRPTHQMAPVPSGRPVAWQDPETRRLANRRRTLPVIAVVIGLLVAAGCVALVLTGGMERGWGLPAVVVGAGAAGGCLAGGVLGLVGWARLKRTLQTDAWAPGELVIAAGSRARLTPVAGEPQLVELDMRADRLGTRGATVSVEIVRDGARTVLATDGRKRLIRTWPVAERAADTDTD